MRFFARESPDFYLGAAGYAAEFSRNGRVRQTC
jgi:hypothetical protein